MGKKKLVPFQANQTSEGIKFDITQEPDLSQFTIPSTYSLRRVGESLVLLEGKAEGSEADTSEPILEVVSLTNSVKAIVANSENVIYSDSTQDTIKKGWSSNILKANGFYYWENNGIKQSYKITSVNNVANWNGTLAKSIEKKTEAPQEDLVPFRVGQTIKGITIDPTAKSVDEIIEWLNTLSYTPGDGGLTVLLSGKDSEANSDELVMVGENDGIKMLVFNITSDLFLYFVSADVPDMMSKGWNIQDENNGNTITPVTEKTTFNGDTYEITTIAEQFAFLNGSVIGAVEGEAPQETLTPFRVGQTINAIKIDTNAKTNEELTAFVAQFDSGEGFEKAFMTYHNNEWPIIGVQGSPDFGYFIDTTSNDAGDGLIWISKAMDLDSIILEHAGWYLANGDTGSVEEVSGIVELQLGETITVDNIDDTFSELNGTVFGAVETTGDPLIPFRDGQRISGVVVDPTVKTDEEIANWLNNLPNEQHLVELNDPNGIGVSEINGVKTLTMFLDPVWITFSADAISGDISIPKGWSYKEQSSGSAEFMPITERTLLGFNTLEVATVYSEFDFLNGIVVGANEVETPEGGNKLTKLEVGQRIGGLKLNTGITPDLSQFNVGETGELVLVKGTTVEAGELVEEPILTIMDGGFIGGGNTITGNKAILIGTDAIVYGDGVQVDSELIDDWYGNILDLEDNYTITYVSDLVDWNGTWISGIEASDESQKTPVPFTVGSVLTRLKFDTNARPDLSQFNVGETGRLVLVKATRVNYEGQVVEEPLIEIWDGGFMDGNNVLTGKKAVVIMGDLPAYAENLEIDGMVMDGWYNSMVSLPDNYTITYVSELSNWNGIWAGSLDAVDEPREPLIQFENGQSIDGIKILPNAKLNNEVAEWLNGFNVTTTLIETPRAEVKVSESGKKTFEINLSDSHKIMFVPENTTIVVSENNSTTELTAIRGWNLIGNSQIDHIEYPTGTSYGSYIVNGINERFTFLNGTVLGAEETKTLTPFEYGQTYKGVIIDPNAKSVEKISNWMNTLPYNGSPFILVGEDITIGSIALLKFSDLGIDGDYPKMLGIILGDASYVLFNPESYNIENTPAGTITIPQGWSYLGFNDDDNTIIVTPIAELTTYNDESPEAAGFNVTVNTMEFSEFEFLNGIVIGAVGVADTPDVPQEPLVRFVVHQTINGIKVDTNAKTNDDLNIFISKLDTGVGLDKAFVTYFEGDNEHPVITAQGNADRGYIMSTTSNDAGDSLIWVSKNMELDGAKFEHAGWYLTNDYTSSMSEASGIVELSLNKTITVSADIDAAFDSELNGIVFGAVEGEAPTGPTTTLTNIEVGQRLKGIKFDTSKTPDLSQYIIGEYGGCNLINSTDDKGESQSFMFAVVDLSTMGLGSGRAIVVAGVPIAYSEVEIANYGGQHIPQGWNTNYLDENGVGLFKESEQEPQQYVNVTEILNGDLWNGVWAGAVLADSEPETPTTFVDGQTINGITVSPNVKTDTEMIEWLNGFSETTVLVDTPRAEVEIPLTGAKTFSITLSDNKQIMFVSEDTTIKGSSVTKGWHCLEGTETIGGQQSIQSHTAFSGNTYTVTGVTEAFAFLNGVVLGAVEATSVPDAPQETLVPFRVGQRINGITIDPTAKTNEEIANWFNTLSYTPYESTGLMAGRQTRNSNIVEVGYHNGVKTLIFFADDDHFLVFTPEGAPNRGLSMSWYYINGVGGTPIPVTEKTTFDSNYEITTIAEQFAFLNGTVLGAVEGEAPQGSYISFRPGQAINCIEVTTNAKTNDELSAFVAKALEGQGDTKTLVSDSVGKDIVTIRGSADFGYVIATSVDNDNYIIWVSKGLELDGIFTFPSAGWYLTGKNTHSVEEASGITSISFGGTPITIGENIDAAFNSELNGIVFVVIAA